LPAFLRELFFVALSFASFPVRVLRSTLILIVMLLIFVLESVRCIDVIR
jgi:hypothetical protein